MLKDLSSLISSLSPEQLQLFNLRLRNRKPHLLKLQPIPRRDVDGACPLTFEQERLWFVQKLFPLGAAYNVNSAFRFSGALDLALLERSLAEVLRRHGALRTHFITVEGRPFQVVSPEGRPEIPVVDLRGLATEDRGGELMVQLGERARQAFDLAVDSPIRLTLLRMGDEEYALLVTMHHIVTDWWSFGIFRRELLTFYSDFSQGRPPSLPELPIQFADFASWQRQWLQGEMLERQLGYWRERLDGVPTVLDLATDHARPSIVSFRGARQSIPLSRELAERLKALVRQEDASLFNTIVAAFAVLLSRWSGQDDLLIGTPVADRHRPETEPLIGYFLNLLVLRMNLSERPTFQQLLAQAREVVQGAFAHQDLPFGKLTDELDFKRELNRMPLFQAAFIYITESHGGDAEPDGGVSGIPLDPGISRVDVTLVFQDTPREPNCFFEYSLDLFDPATMARMGGHLTALLADAVTRPDGAVRDLAFLSEAERYQLVHEWSSAPAAAGEGSVLDLFEAQVARVPDRVAVAYGDVTLTYGGLAVRASRVALCLHELDQRTGSRVGLCLERSPEAVAGILGILRAGCAYVPLDPRHSAERLAFMAADSGLGALVSERSLADRWPLPPERVVLAEGGPAGPPDPAAAVRPGDLAYVIYTSGSTGEPQGVAVAHGNLAWSTRARLAYHPEPAEVFLSTFSFHFDGSVAGLFGTLCQGGTLVVVDESLQLDAAGLAAEVERLGVSHLLCPPFLYGLVLEGTDPERLASLRKVIVAAEACPGRLVDLHGRRLPETALCNEYGPTEAAVWCSAQDCSDLETRRPVPIGRPVGGAALYILDAGLEPLPAGVAGELYVGGEGVAAGYLNRPNVTAARFLPDPFGAAPGGRLFRTRDLVRYRADGAIEFLGRTDHQIKLRGYRIEPAEIEAVLLRHPGVSQAVAVMREDVSGDRRLVAYVVVDRETGPNVRELRRLLLESLPGPMVPSAVVMLDSLPRNSAGKVDRQALPAPSVERPDLESTYRAPRTETERLLAAVWQEVLGLSQVGVHDNFFELGGSSMLVLRLHEKQNRLLGPGLEMTDIFRYPTINALAEHLSGEEASHASPEEEQARVVVRSNSRERQQHSSERRRLARRQF